MGRYKSVKKGISKVAKSKALNKKFTDSANKEYDLRQKADQARKESKSGLRTRYENKANKERDIKDKWATKTLKQMKENRNTKIKGVKNSDGEVAKWITVNGAHVPIYKGESKTQALNRKFKENRSKLKEKYNDAENEFLDYIGISRWYEEHDKNMSKELKADVKKAKENYDKLSKKVNKRIKGVKTMKKGTASKSSAVRTASQMKKKK